MKQQANSENTRSIICSKLYHRRDYIKSKKREKDEKEYGEVKYCFKVCNALLELTDAA